MSEFKLVECNDDHVVVEHMAEGHQFTFNFVEGEDGRRVLSASATVIAVTTAHHEAKYWHNDAWRFASAEAEKSGRFGTPFLNP